MSPPESVRMRRRRLGARIKTARRAARVTQVQVMGVLGCSQSTVTKIENGSTTISAANLDRLIDFLGVDGETADWMRQHNTGARARPVRRAGPAWFGDYPELEQRASDIRSWTGERIPGVLQSEQYMVAQFEAAGCPNVDELVEARKDRQRVFDRDGRREFLLSESALDRLRGWPDPAMVLDEVQHLLKCGDMPEVGVRILRYSATLYPELDFTMLRLPDEEELVYVEYPSGKQLLNQEKHLEQYRNSWAQLDELALSREDSARFLIALREQLVSR
ncbi:helix-turn-helix domain-containing protein [Amycolatopsis magusensis]|uniref:Transcriptional regulator with XRE-family HTH domain n=1 Tax=Amycolatopsis magusensis TaxID=882444 RepID=A0ABS4PNG2_9PSEU|nr:helix-turn-helix transcriptional regulator [Amycolatopsis magusensis]MBP2180951.1 transcriptional regulator with XRE-family HTH domain [Amycolatopsis magusensis]